MGSEKLITAGMTMNVAGVKRSALILLSDLCVSVVK